MSKQKYVCIRKCYWGPPFERGQMVHPRKVYEIGDTELMDPKDPWVIESCVLMHFVPAKEIPVELEENPEQYATRIAEGLKAPLVSDRLDAPGNFPHVSELDSIRAAERMPIDALKFAMMADASKTTKQ